jgi:hypothetical protein
MPEPPPLEGEAKNRRPSPLNPKTPDIPKLPVLRSVNLAPSVLLPAEVRKENPFLPCDVNPRPYPNEYGRLFFEDESGNNRIVPSERAGEWAASPYYLEIHDIPELPVLLTVNLAPSVLLPAESSKKTRPCLDDANPRPYPNEYGRLFFEDESGNNRMVTSERTGERAAPPL